MYKFVLDVESVGLYGESFAVAVVVFDKKNIEKDRLFLYCDSKKAIGLNDDRKWIEKHVTLHLGSPNCDTLHEMRERFWNFYIKYRKISTVYGHRIFPVETNFFLACVKDDENNRKFLGPNPINDMSCLDLFVHKKNYCRLPSELPEHNPLNDVLFTWRKFNNALEQLYKDVND